MNDITLFTHEQGNLLIRLCLAHLLADFAFQTKAMVENKKWFGRHMLLHIVIVAATTLLFTLSWQLALAAAVIHWIIDGSKCSLTKAYPKADTLLFFADQLLHILSLILIWGVYNHLGVLIFKAALLPFVTYKMSLIILGYVVVIWPLGFALQFALKGIAKTTNKREDENVEHGGKLIGLFERLIILTLVLLGEYSAIGFLITGKSIIRFAQKEENLRSEYVLVGTMMSYALAILVGVLINWLMKIG